MKMINEIFPGTRVMIFDPSLYIDDIKTPLTKTVKPATVVSRYGMKCLVLGELCTYTDLVDVVFDHRPNKISHGHFTNSIKAKFIAQ